MSENADDPPGTKKTASELKRIKSSSITRGLSLLGMTVSTGAKYLGLKVGDVFLDDADKATRARRFLSEQVEYITEEFGKLKGSFMKVGQMLSVYGEYYLPPEVNAVLKRLQSESKPVGWEVMEKVIRRNLGIEAFSQLEINPTPVSAASLGQVYEAKRRSDGRILALKVQYPGVDKAIDNDLRVAKSILTLSKLVPAGPGFDEIFDEVRTMLHHESDYTRELSRIEEFRALLGDDPRYVVPEVFPEFSNRRVLCMSYETGLKIDDPEVLSFSQERRNRIGTSVLDLMFMEMFQWRLVQTDCHFGNFRIRPQEGASGEDRIVLFDFGAIRKFPKRYIQPFSDLVAASLCKDSEAVVGAALELGFLEQEDSDENRDLFVDLCFRGVEPFDEEYESDSLTGEDMGDNPYAWSDTELVGDLSEMARTAVFAFKFRPPPRESVFLNRKMVGTYFILRKIGYLFGPRRLILKYVRRT